MSQYTRLHAANLLLAALGNPSADGQAAYWLAGWSSHEIQCGIGCSAPQNNLWATELCMPGSTNFNNWNIGGSCDITGQHGAVQNYLSLSLGITAALTTLHNGLYKNLLAALQSNNIAALTNGSVQADLQTWCGSVCYSQDTANFIAEGQAHANDIFDDNASGSSNTLAVTANPIGSCKACVIGLPLGCPTNEQCVLLDSAGDIAPNGLSLAGVCVSNSYVNSAAVGSSAAPDSIVVCQRIKSGTQPIPAGANPINQFLPAWIVTPDWGRVLKFVLGLVALGFGLLLAFSILSDNSTIKSALKVAAIA